MLQWVLGLFDRSSVCGVQHFRKSCLIRDEVVICDGYLRCVVALASFPETCSFHIHEQHLHGVYADAVIMPIQEGVYPVQQSNMG